MKLVLSGAASPQYAVDFYIDHVTHWCGRFNRRIAAADLLTMMVVYDIPEPEESKTTASAVPATGRPPAIKSILKTSTTTTSESPPTPTSKSDVTMTSGNDAATASPGAKRRGILKKQLSFETEEPTSVKRQCPPPPPPPPSTEPQRPRPDRPASAGASVVTPTASALAVGDFEEEGSAAARTPRIKNKAVARRLMLRDRRSFDDETMTSFPGDDRSLNDGR